MDFADEAPKLLMLLYGLIAFVVVVGGLLLLLDVVPTWFARRREAALLAASTAAAGPATTAATVRARRRRSVVNRREGGFGFFFLLPALLLLAVGLVVPAIRTVVLSFKDGNSENWVGLRNYTWMFAQDEIFRVLINTLTWVIVVPLAATAIGLVYAVLVDRSRFEAVAKALIFMPMAISFVGASIIWRFVYAYRSAEYDQIGLLNHIWVLLGGEPQRGRDLVPSAHPDPRQQVLRLRQRLVAQIYPHEIEELQIAALLEQQQVDLDVEIAPGRADYPLFESAQLAHRTAVELHDNRADLVDIDSGELQLYPDPANIAAGVVQSPW